MALGMSEIIRVQSTLLVAARPASSRARSGGVVTGGRASPLFEPNADNFSYHSRQAIKKYVLANNNLSGVSEAAITTQFNKALQRGSESGVFARPKGTSR